MAKAVLGHPHTTDAHQQAIATVVAASLEDATDATLSSLPV